MSEEPVKRLSVNDAYDIGVALDEISLRTARFMPLQPRINEIQVAVNDAILEALLPVATALTAERALREKAERERDETRQQAYRAIEERDEIQHDRNDAHKSWKDAEARAKKAERERDALRKAASPLGSDE